MITVALKYQLGGNFYVVKDTWYKYNTIKCCDRGDQYQVNQYLLHAYFQSGTASGKACEKCVEVYRRYRIRAGKAKRIACLKPWKVWGHQKN